MYLFLFRNTYPVRAQGTLAVATMHLRRTNSIFSRRKVGFGAVLVYFCPTDAAGPLLP